MLCDCTLTIFVQHWEHKKTDIFTRSTATYSEDIGKPIIKIFNTINANKATYNLLLLKLYCLYC